LPEAPTLERVAAIITTGEAFRTSIYAKA